MAATITAYGVYTYLDDPAGMTGRIIDTGGTSTGAITAAPGMDTMGPDPQVEGFINPSNVPLICSTERVTSGAPKNTIFNIDGSPPGTTVNWPSIDNLYGLVAVGNYLYALDYDNSSIVEIDPATYIETGRSYTYSTTVPNHTARGQAILNIDGELFGLFAVPNNTWTDYEPSVLIKFDIPASGSIGIAEINETDIAKNAFSMAVSGDLIYIASIGGAQGAGSYNPDSRIQSVDHTGDLSIVDDEMSPSPAFPYEFRDISFDGSTAYILGGAYNGNWELVGELVSTTNFVNLTTINDFTSGADGYFWAAQYISDNDRIFMGRGNEVLVYDASNNSLLETLDMSDLGPDYTNLDAMSYVGVDTTAPGARAASPALPRPIRGYRSPLQASASQRARLARQITQGRPELTTAERQQLDAQLAQLKPEEIV